MIPVIMKNDSIKYLEMSSKRLFDSSRKVPCAKKTNYYIKDYANRYWKYDHLSGFSQSKIKGYVMHESHISLPQIEAFNDKILTRATAHSRSNTLLEAIADQKRDFQKIQDIKENGGGNLVRGVA